MPDLLQGFGPSEAARIHRTVIRHLTFLAMSPRHRTRESNVNLFNRLDRLTPLADLCKVLEMKHLAWQKRRESL